MRAGKRSHYLPDKKILIVAAGIIIITVVIIVFIYKSQTKEQNKERVSKGISYLESLENQNVAEIQEVIKSIRVRHGLKQADTDESGVWSSFEDSVILGDSRAVGFSYYELLPEERVMAESGSVITDVSGYMERLKRLNPERVFLCFGVNDVKSGLWPEPADYAAECAAQMQWIMNELPGSQVYLNSILPVGGAAIWDASYAEIVNYNAAMRAMAEQNGYHFIDNAYIAEAHGGLYQADGLHLQPDFYKYWAANMLTEVNEQ